MRRLPYISRGRVLIAGLMQGTAIPGIRCLGGGAVISLENAAEITLCTHLFNAISDQPLCYRSAARRLIAIEVGPPVLGSLQHPGLIRRVWIGQTDSAISSR